MWFKPTLLFIINPGTSVKNSLVTFFKRGFMRMSTVGCANIQDRLSCLKKVAWTFVFGLTVHLVALKFAQLSEVTLFKDLSLIFFSYSLIIIQRNLIYAFAVSSAVTGGVIYALSVSVFFFWKNLFQVIGFTELYASLTSSVKDYLNGNFFEVVGTQQNLISTPAADLDFSSATDFEDLLVFTLDALELLWQDVNLAVELCGDNALGLGFGFGFAGISWISKKIFSTKRLKK